MSANRDINLAGVIGWPIQHSRSPRLHNFWLSKYRISGFYVPLQVHPDKLEVAVRALPNLGFKGANVTIPHKEKVLDIVDECDPLASRVGAINTLYFEHGEKIVGANTDVFGFTQALCSGSENIGLDNAKAVVIGAGGAARAIVVGLLDLGASEIRIVNRTYEKAVKISERFGKNVQPIKWQQRSESLTQCQVLVNTTSLGMIGNPALDLDVSELPLQATVMDTVYTPLMTPLLKTAKSRGNRVVDGLGMLLHQARPGFAHWFNHDPRVTKDLHAHVLSDLDMISG